MLLPIILRLLGKFQGIPKKTGLELSLMTRFFIFQVIVSVLRCLPRPSTHQLARTALLFDCNPQLRVDCGASRYYQTTNEFCTFSCAKSAFGVDFLLYVSSLCHNVAHANMTPMYIRYMILQGLSGTAGGFLQIVNLIVYYVKLVLLGSTPRSVYTIKYGAQGVQWGTLFPGITLLVIISAFSLLFQRSNLTVR
jgi:calcium permeable stress-gated cation channel